MCFAAKLVFSGLGLTPFFQRELDAVYEEKLLLSDVARMISPNVLIENASCGIPYVGSTSIDNVIDAVGLRAGILRYSAELFA